ncbi:MAG TPA: cytidine deaminase [bacterium]|nr:cytidine deaminase [bacterium]
MNKQQLLSVARTALKNCYAPYSRINVAAALLTGDGMVATGVNVENSSYGLTVCAERVALCKAVSEGYTAFTAIAVVSDSLKTIAPCGACLQVLAEFSPKMAVITQGSDGKTTATKLNKLLPRGFRIHEKSNG